MRDLRTLFHSASWVGLLALLLMSTSVYADDTQAAADQVSKEAEAIHNAIMSLTDYDVFDWVTFDIQGPTVVLNGYASRPILKNSVQNVVAKVPGVKDVMNNIKVLPLSSYDDQLRTRLYFKIYDYSPLAQYNPNWGTPLFNSAARMTSGLTYDPPSGPHSIHIIVDNGHVILEGVVNTEGDRILAGSQARSTAGVFSVENDLAVLHGSAKNKKSNNSSSNG